MAKRAYRWMWTARIDPTSLPMLQALAVSLGFVVDTPGGFEGKPSPAAMLDALAAAYRRDPRGTNLALQGLLDANDLLPHGPPAADPTD